MDKRLYWAGGIIALLIVGALLWGTMRQEPVPEEKAKRFEEEPTITVYDHVAKSKRQMRLEEYLKGVVAGEMKPGWPQEAYAAQAIVARTYTMAFIKRGGTQKLHGTDISTDEEEAQAYNAANISPAIERAVESTRGQVITYNGEYIEAWFSSSAGGRTARAQEGLNYEGPEPPYTVSVASPDDEYAPPEVKAWTAEFALTELAELLQKEYPQIKEIENVRISQRGPSGRATQWEVVHTEGRERIPARNFRLLAGAQRLRSMVITDLKVEDGKMRVQGKGFGHGVGLSQYGAYALAEQGKTAQEIIKYYFRNVEITQLWD